MITKFKLYENNNDINNKKPNVDSEDFHYEWHIWAIELLDELFGKHYQGGNADWGGLILWSLDTEDGYNGYFIIKTDDDEIIFMKRTFIEEIEENDDVNILTTTPDDNNLEDLIIKVGETIPKYKDITEIYRTTRNLNKYKI